MNIGLYRHDLFVLQNLSTSQGVNFINVKRANFSYEHHFGSFYYVHVTREKLPKQRSYKKFASITLMKLTEEFLVK